MSFFVGSGLRPSGPRVVGLAADHALAASVGACRSQAGADGRTAGAAVGSAASFTPPPLPADHLNPGELIEGSTQALGVTLPRELTVDETFSKVVFASGPLRVHPLVEYFRGHLRGGDLREGERSATFHGVTAIGKEGPIMSVHIAQIRDGARVEFRDETPVPAPDLPDEAARWKHAGLTPSGRVANPTHLD
jgi:hypothetical protein